MKRMIYKEDNQMYYFTPVVFETNAPLTAEVLSKMSWTPVGAGRHSTSFETFKELVEELGFTVNEVIRLEANVIPDLGYPIVEGATGNY